MNAQKLILNKGDFCAILKPSSEYAVAGGMYMSARVILLASGKGGTGKTTVTALLGAALAARGLRTLLVEVAAGLRSIDTAAGVSGRTVYDLGDVLAGRCEPEKAVAASPLYSELFVMCAPYAGGRIEPRAFVVMCERLRAQYDIILLDVASGMGGAFAAASAVADAALLVITPDAVCARDGHIVADALGSAGHLDVRLVLNKVPRALADAGLEDLDACIDTVGVQLIGVLPFSTQIMRVSATGVPLDENSRVQAAFAALAARLCGQAVPLVFC